MKKFRRAPLPDDVCMCLPELGRVCVWCQNKPAPETVEEADALGDECPWNPDELPPHLRGLGYRGADQDGYDGSEWVTPEEHNAGNLIEAARELFDAREIT